MSDDVSDQLAHAHELLADIREQLDSDDMAWEYVDQAVGYTETAHVLIAGPDVLNTSTTDSDTGSDEADTSASDQTDLNGFGIETLVTDAGDMDP